MKRLLVMYGAIHVNVLLVSLYLVGWLNGAWLTVLQVTFSSPCYCGAGKGLRYRKETYP